MEMKVDFVSEKCESIAVDNLTLLLPETYKQTAVFKSLDALCDKHLSKSAELFGFEGKKGQSCSITVPSSCSIKAKMIQLYGIDKLSDFTSKKAREAAGAIARGKKKKTSIALSLTFTQKIPGS